MTRTLSSMMAILLVASSAAAGPIDAKKLTIRERASVGAPAVLTFVTNDASISAAGGAGDPTQGTRLWIRLFTPTGDIAIEIPTADIEVRDGRRDTFIYQGPGLGGAESIKLVMREGGRIKLRIRGLQLEHLPPFEGDGVAIFFDADSFTADSCAAFVGAAVVRDEDGVFIGANASALAVANCSQQVLTDVLTGCGQSAPQCGGECPTGGVCGLDVISGTCSCSFPYQPCGDTDPVCNGECPVGEECSLVNPGHPFDSCVCAPTGENPCGGGGDYCPEGMSCELLPGTELIPNYMQCIDEDAVCGEPGFGSCPFPLQCARNFNGWDCSFIQCNFNYPTCGGSGCPAGSQCLPASIPGSFELCLCGVP